MKILVTGKRGQLGKSIAKIVSNSSHENEFTFVGREEFDLSSSKSISEYFDTKPDFEIIINCAAYTSVDKAEEERDLAEKINHLAVKQIAEFAHSQNAKLIHISTDYVFDGKNESLYLETDKPNPINVYGKTKFQGERAVLEIMPNNAMIIRTSWVYSEFGTNFVKTMLKLGGEKDEISVVSDQIGSPTNAIDLASAILKITTNKNFIKKNFPTEIYHFSNSGDASWHDFAKEIFKLTGLDCKLRPIVSEQYPTPAKRPRNTTLNTDKIIKNFNLRIPVWQKSLKKLLVEKLKVNFG